MGLGKHGDDVVASREQDWPSPAGCTCKQRESKLYRLIPTEGPRGDPFLTHLAHELLTLAHVRGRTSHSHSSRLAAGAVMWALARADPPTGVEFVPVVAACVILDP